MREIPAGSLRTINHELAMSVCFPARCKPPGLPVVCVPLLLLVLELLQLMATSARTGRLLTAYIISTDSRSQACNSNTACVERLINDLMNVWLHVQYACWHASVNNIYCYIQYVCDNCCGESTWQQCIYNKGIFCSYKRYVGGSRYVLKGKAKEVELSSIGDIRLEGSFDRVGRVVALNCTLFVRVCVFHLLWGIIFIRTIFIYSSMLINLSINSGCNDHHQRASLTCFHLFLNALLSSTLDYFFSGWHRFCFIVLPNCNHLL